MKNVSKAFAVLTFLMVFCLPVQAQPTTGTWMSDGDFPAGEWMELFLGGGEGQPGNEISASNAVDYSFDSATIGADPDDVVLLQDCADPDYLAFMYRTFYYNGILTLSNDVGTPWENPADLADEFLVSMGPVTNLTTKYVEVDTCDQTGEISFDLTAVGMFDAYPDYYAHVTAHYDGTPVPSADGMSDLLDWAKISISPPTPVDVKPGSCKNPVNVKSQGVLPVVVMGTDLLDVTMIDPSTILLEGVPPLRWALEDVGSPMGEPEEGEEPDCSAGETPDGTMDLVLKFSTQAILAAIGPVEDGDLVPLILTGDTEDFPVIGQDVITIIKRGRIRVSEDDDGDDPGDGGRDGDNGLHNGWTNGNGNAYGRDRDEHPGLRRGHNKSNDEGEDVGSEDAEESGSGGSGNGNGQGKDKDKGEKAGGNNGNGADKGNGNKNGHNDDGD